MCKGDGTFPEKNPKWDPTVETALWELLTTTHPFLIRHREAEEEEEEEDNSLFPSPPTILPSSFSFSSQADCNGPFCCNLFTFFTFILEFSPKSCKADAACGGRQKPALCQVPGDSSGDIGGGDRVAAEAGQAVQGGSRAGRGAGLCPSARELRLPPRLRLPRCHPAPQPRAGCLHRTETGS